LLAERGSLSLSSLIRIRASYATGRGVVTDITREILVAALTGEEGEVERRLLKAWREADPRNEEEFQRIQRLWTLTGGLADFTVGVEPPRAKSILSAASFAEIAPRTRSSTARRLASKGSWMIAASLAVGLGIGILTSIYAWKGEFGPQVVVTGAGEAVTVTLEDGTLVRLAPNSRLEFGDGEGRTVDLEGRAYFAVARRDGDPFQVHLPERTITVLGTRFDAEGRVGRTRIAVVEGEVVISGSGDAVTAGANQVAYGPDSGTLLVEQVEDVFQSMEWLGGFLAFETTPLPEVAQELERRFQRRVEIVNPALEDRTVTGWFADQAPEELIAAICGAVGANCAIEGDHVRMDLLSPSPTPP
jgi:transmembrane sensor